MPKNSIEACVEFSFKGEDYAHSSRIDLDRLLSQHDALPSIHALLARLHGIDTYSYLYEVMQEAEVTYSNPQGSASDYMVDGEFSLASLASNWQSAKATLLLQPIAERELGINDLNQHHALKRALVAAYNLGRGA
ncbi:MAG: hypothetical protein WC216_05830 [Gallionella sp.]